MVSESDAKLQEYIAESKEKQETIVRKIRDEKDKEIERLKKEKEWLLHNFAEVHCQALRIYNDGAIKERKELIIREMQQALKENEPDGR